MFKSFVLGIFLILATVSSLLADPQVTPGPSPKKTPLTKRNPGDVKRQVEDISALFDQVQSDIRHKKLKEEHNDSERANLAGEKTLYLDRSGQVRAYYTSFGSDDSMADWMYIYDKAGRLRMVLAHAGYVNGNRSEDQKIFLDEGGNILQVNSDKKWEDLETGAKKHEKKVLSEPENVHGFEIDFGLDPKTDFKEAWDVGKEPEPERGYPIVGFSVGVPATYNLVVGYHLENLGLKMEGFYWDTAHWGTQVDLSNGVQGGYGNSHSWFSTSVVLGVSDHSPQDSSTWFYGGVGVELCIEGLDAEVDLVNGDIFNSKPFSLAVPFKFGYIQRF